MVTQRVTVGIFSRDDEDSYKWLINLLRAAMFQSFVEYVLPVRLTSNYRSFTDTLTHCSFAILYHTKKRGRINITNVNDSLYDEELKNLAEELGRDAVVVVLDDIEDSSDGNKRRILENQPLIRDCACDLILISEMEKLSANITGPDPRWSLAPVSPSLQDAYESIHAKMYKIRNFLEDVNTDDRPRRNSYSDSETQSGGYRSSVTTRSTGYKLQDGESFRSSVAPSSVQGSDRPLFPSQNATTPATLPEETYNLHMMPEDNLELDRRQKKSRLGASRNWCKNISDKTVFIIIGALIVILLIILIVILCVAL